MKRTFLCLALLLVSGCGVITLVEPPERPAPSEQEKTTKQDKAEASAEDCQWQSTRGVAQLVEKLNGTARFEFYPGELEATAPSDPDWHPGDEFKAKIRHADQKGCGMTIEIMESLEST